MFGKAVLYEGEGGKTHLALIRSTGGGNTADLVVFIEDGVAMHNDVPRRDEGGGHTWRPA